jgi:S1-C subfamily serine protease
MRLSVITATLIITATVAPADATDWVSVVRDIESRVPRVQIAWADGSSGSCSAVFINATTGYLVSAAHCFDGPVEPHITVASRDAAIVRSNRILDLALLRVTPRKGDVTVPLAAETPQRGTEVAVAGYAFGFAQLSTQYGRLALPYRLEDGTQLVNVDLIAGDSGGAVIDSSGALVGIVSAVIAHGPMHLGVVVPVERLRDYVGQYLPQDKP